MYLDLYFGKLLFCNGFFVTPKKLGNKYTFLFKQHVLMISITEKVYAQKSFKPYLDGT